MGMASSLGSSSWLMVWLAPSSDTTTARGHATIKLLSRGVTLRDGAEFEIGVKIVSFALGCATISAISLVSSFCCSSFDGVADCCGAATLGVGLGVVFFIPTSLLFRQLV